MARKAAGHGTYMTPTFAIKIEVDDGWITPEYDHVHHGRMLSLFEQARLALVAAIGFPNEQLMAEGKVLVITGVQAAYRREVKRGAVEVTCDAVEIDDRTIRIQQRLINDRQKVAVEAEFSLMFMDATTRRGMLPPPDFAAAITERLAEKR